MNLQDLTAADNLLGQNQWHLITPEFLATPPDWFREQKFWVSDGKELIVAEYEWQQGWRPDRLISGGANYDALGCRWFVRHMPKILLPEVVTQ